MMEAWRNPDEEEWGNSMPVAANETVPEFVFKTLHKDATEACPSWPPGWRYEIRRWNDLVGWYACDSMQKVETWPNVLPGPHALGYLLLGQYTVPN